ncbi:MAG: type II toxin-antitoxin system Phd/YefM family antitoxin [Candidatus Binatia bacterium]
MSRVAVQELKNHLTRYLRRTQRGEELVVTERGTPIALIRSVDRAEKIPDENAKLATLAARGLVTLPSQKPLKKIRRVKISGRPLSKKIVDERR